MGWRDIRAGHSAAEAWRMGFRGAGVRVAVLDSGVDYAHYDLQGTWPVLPEGHPYAGWPQVYDPTAAYQYVLARKVGADDALLRKAYVGLIELYQESDVTQVERDGRTVSTACFRPLGGSLYGPARQLRAEACDYIVPPSQSGRVRFGHHPDPNLARIRMGSGDPSAPPDRTQGEYVGVLLVDALEAGVYDTAYVDLDSDHDFTDEKPVTKASPLSWHDIDDPADGIADLSGGLMYYLADGELPIPGAYLWGLQDDVPRAGSLVGLFYDPYAHGTLCASNVVSQGRLGDTRRRLSFRDLPGGAPDAVNPGMAPEARLVGVGNALGAGIVSESAWRYVVFGHDPSRSDDDIQIASNSYGDSGVDNDGWDADSRMIDYYVRTFSPSTIFLVSTGNGAPGYGTLAPPSPATGLGIGSSTQFGAAVGLSITDTTQITFGDIAAFSNRGPGADGRIGPNLAANGANGWGGVPINLLSANAQAINARRGRGSMGNIPWGGTSRSSPIAAGGLALAYEAFRAANGRWPSWAEARGIVMSGARFAGYDVFTMGAGVLDIADAVRIAAGGRGVYAQPAEWTAGGYRGVRYPGFAKVVSAGSSVSTTIALRNPGSTDVRATLGGGSLRRLRVSERSLKTKLAAESPYDSVIPDYIVPIDRDEVPAGTELLVVRAILPMAQADADGDGAAILENGFTVRVIRHTDQDGDGRLWVDADANGAVNFQASNGAVDWSTAEIDRYEFETMNEDTSETNNWTVPVHHPLERWGDGLYVAVWHSEMACADPSDPATCTGRTTLAPDTDMQLRIESFAYGDWDWLAIEPANVTVPAGGDAEVGITLSIPEGASPGSYQGAVFADYERAEDDPPMEAGGGFELPFQRVVIPVSANVAAAYDWRGTVALGGVAGRDMEAPYDNGVLRGGIDRTWRPETGDWRFFFLDTPRPAPGTRWLVRTRWDDPQARASDIDTSVWSAARDRFSDPTDPANAGEDRSDPAWYGPHTLARVASSRNAYAGGGTWWFDTSSGQNEDWIAGSAGGGLAEVMMHNVLFSGAQFALPFETTVASLRVRPERIQLYSDECSRLHITSQMDLAGFQMRAIGLAAPARAVSHTITPGEPYAQTVTVEDVAGRFVVELRGEPGTDVDLAVLYDEDRDGQIDRQLAVSESPTEYERIALPGLQPPGDYLVVVVPADVPAGGAEFELTIDVVVGADLRIESVPSMLEAAREYSVDVCTEQLPSGGGPLDGVVVFGPEGAPAVLSVPATWQTESPKRSIYLPRLGGALAR